MLGIALGCGKIEMAHDARVNVGGAGATHSVGSSAAGASGQAGSDDETPGGAGGMAGKLGVGGRTSVAGAGGMPSVYFWTEATQHIEIECFGLFDGLAAFRADRSELSAAQLSLLAVQTGVPGSSYDGNDDQIHCWVTTTDAQGDQREFTLDDRSELIARETNLGEGGAAGDAEEIGFTILGCELRHPSSIGRRPFSANPLCLQAISTDFKVSTFLLDLAIPGKPYRVELVHCEKESLVGTTVELFGVDPETPLATGVIPDEPGPDGSCFVLDVQVAAKVVGRLVVVSSPGSVGPYINQMIFR